VILSLGALTWEKDPLAQVEVATAVLRRSSRAVFLIVGEGPLHGDVARAVADTGLEHRILRLGNRPDPGDLLAASDVLLMTSRTEGVPGAAIEAAMARVPVVAYSTGGISEAIRDGATGLLSPPGELGTLIEHILSLLEDEDARRRMGATAAEWSRRFDIGTVALRYLRLYRTLMGNRTTIEQEATS
jgi:glycosyltransferase involved in cell wall biosynthesis